MGEKYVQESDPQIQEDAEVPNQICPNQIDSGNPSKLKTNVYVAPRLSLDPVCPCT